MYPTGYPRSGTRQGDQTHHSLAVNDRKYRVDNTRPPFLAKGDAF